MYSNQQFPMITTQNQLPLQSLARLRQSPMDAMNQQQPFGIQSYGPQSGSMIQSRIQDQNRELFHDSLIKKLVDLNRFSRRSDHLLRHLIQGKSVTNEMIVDNLSGDRGRDEEICEIIDCLVERRKQKAMVSNIRTTPELEMLKNKIQHDFDTMITTHVRQLLMREKACHFGL